MQLSQTALTLVPLVIFVYGDDCAPRDDDSKNDGYDSADPPNSDPCGICEAARPCHHDGLELS